MGLRLLGVMDRERIFPSRDGPAAELWSYVQNHDPRPFTRTSADIRWDRAAEEPVAAWSRSYFSDEIASKLVTSSA